MDRGRPRGEPTANARPGRRTTATCARDRPDVRILDARGPRHAEHGRAAYARCCRAVERRAALLGPDPTSPRRPRPHPRHAAAGRRDGGSPGPPGRGETVARRLPPGHVVESRAARGPSRRAYEDWPPSRCSTVALMPAVYEEQRIAGPPRRDVGPTAQSVTSGCRRQGDVEARARGPPEATRSRRGRRAAPRVPRRRPESPSCRTTARACRPGDDCAVERRRPGSATRGAAQPVPLGERSGRGELTYGRRRHPRPGSARQTAPAAARLARGRPTGGRAIDHAGGRRSTRAAAGR